MEGATTAEIIKADARGRMRYTAEFRQEVLEAFERSGMSAAGFARQCGVKYQTFAGWVKRHRKTRKQAAETVPVQPGGAAKFLLAEIGEAESVANGLSVRLAGGAVASVSSHAELPLLVELIRALA